MLVYRFIDASVPPQYHRSYTITVGLEGVNFTVDCYGSILAKYTLPLSEKKFFEFLTQLRQVNIVAVEPNEDKGCSGGKTDQFNILLDDIKISGYVYHCADKTYGNLKGDTAAVARLFKALVPALVDKIRV